ncbi:MAG: exonuclease domain-containing protein [Candidatus Cyclobacteriaceae bacterium M3_2C_046]
MEYAIVDIETTGNNSDRNRITEIAIFISDGKNVIQRYTSLVNPGTHLPMYISALTSITNEMVGAAPTFSEIAPQVYELLENRVFVAHNVNFDYNFIRSEMMLAGINYQAKKLCTVRLSRKIIPGLKSYGLGSLSRHFNIRIENRHRAEDDAAATVTIFHQLVSLDRQQFIAHSLKKTSGEAVFPPNLSQEQLKKLPEAPGVYYFLNKRGQVIYVGKAKNLIKRVYSHFAGSSDLRHQQRFINSVYGIDYEVCGNELIALLLECQEIKRFWPEFNRSQKLGRLNYGIFLYEDRNGYLRFTVNKNRKGLVPLLTFQKLMEARNYLQKKVWEFQLCAKLCGLQKTVNGCFELGLNSCKGACLSQEPVDSYNTRVKNAIQSFNQADYSYIIKGKGRKGTEQSVVVVENGKYLGFGYIDHEFSVNSLEQVKYHITHYQDNQDAQRILQMYLRKNSNQNIIPLQSL